MVEAKFMTTPKISIISPVYKAEKYLKRCVDSIIAQTLSDWELLLIDDGSPDKSRGICDEYATKDSRVRVFHQENGGVSSARQKGLDEATGKYIIHVDPDDWVEPTMLEELYQKAKNDDADMVICDFYRNEGVRQEYVKQEPIKLDNKTVLFELLFQQLHGSCCNKLVKRVCYSIYGVSFPEKMNCWEDLYVNVSLLRYESVRIAYLPKAFYHYDYAVNTNSLVRRPTKQTVLSQTFFINSLSSELGADFDEAFYRLKVQTKDLAWRFDLMNEEEYKALFPEITERYILDFGKSLNLTKRFVILSFNHYMAARVLFDFFLKIKKIKSLLSK